MKTKYFTVGVIIGLITMLVIQTIHLNDYYNLYKAKPKQYTVTHTIVINKGLVTNGQEYTCTTQKPNQAQVGMICVSNDSTTTIDCTTIPATPTQYWC